MVYNHKRKKLQYAYRSKHRGARYINYASKSVSVATKAALAYAMVKRLNNVVNVEYKFLDQLYTIAPDHFGDLTVLNPIPQGDTDSTRDGDSVKLQNLTIRGRFLGSGTSDQVRVIIFHDKANSISTPSDYIGIGNTAAVLNPKNYDNRFLTKVLYDRTHMIQTTNQQAQFEKVIRLNFHTQFSNGTTTVVSGALKMIVLGTPATATTGFNMVSRLTYTDN